MKGIIRLFYVAKIRKYSQTTSEWKKNTLLRNFSDSEGAKHKNVRIIYVSRCCEAMVCLCNYTMNKDEFSILTKKLRSEIVAIGARYLKDEEEAEDNAQDTLLKLWTIRGQLLQCSSVEGLAYTIGVYKK